jgi:hypothetical protein
MRFLNDLWKFDGQNWIWIAGSKHTNPRGVYGTEGIPSRYNFPGGRNKAMAYIDSSNNIYLFGGDGRDSTQNGIGKLNDLWKLIPMCFEISRNDSTVCSGRGQCISDNICNCTNAIGIECEIPLCFEIPSNAANACSGHGTCISSDHCFCNTNWIGEQCNFTFCFEIVGTSPHVCSGHGICSDTNVCTCEDGWEGIDCSVPQCFGKSGTDKSVCSGNGICIGKDQCKCNPRFTGKECATNRVIILNSSAYIPSWIWLSISIVILWIAL